MQLQLVVLIFIFLRIKQKTLCAIITIGLSLLAVLAVLAVLALLALLAVRLASGLGRPLARDPLPEREVIIKNNKQKNQMSNATVRIKKCKPQSRSEGGGKQM